MSYAKKKLMRMNFPLFDFGGGAAEIMSFKIPKDEHGVAQKARLVDVGVQITEVFLTGTKEGSVKVGTAADPNIYADLFITTAAADKACWNVDNDTNAIIEEDIASGTLVQMTFDFGTDGGTVTGQGVPYVDMYVWK